jgi:hypothetical protein
MNLIEQQSAAKDLPMQYLQQAVNGQNPNLTPWIATAELQRRTTMNQHMAPKGPQGPQPTVKDQVEQKAGLMATQAAQQAQAAQAQQSSTPPGPIPGGIPQPQPQPEEPVMAARGGLMNAPVNFQFAHGGILGFAEAGSVPDPEAAQLASDRKAVEEGLKKFGYAAADIAAMPFRAASALLNTLIVRPARAVTGAEVPYFPMMGGGDNSSVTPFTDRAYKEKQAAAAPAVAAGGSGRGGPGGQGGASAAEMAAQGIKNALPKPPAPPTPPAQAVRPPPAPGAAPAPTAQPAAMDPAEQAAQTYATAPVKQMSLQDAIGEEKGLAGAYGLDKPMGVEERAIRAQQNKDYEDYKGRAGDREFAALVQGARAGPGQSGAMYEQARGQRYKDAAEFQREHLKDISALNTAQRAAQEKRSGIAGSSLGAGKLASAGESKDKAQVGANLSGNRMQSLASKYSADKHAETALAVQKLQDRAAAARQDSSDQKQALAELTQLERTYDADIKSLESQMRPLVGLFTEDAKTQVKALTEQLNLARDLKRRVRGDKGAAPAGTMTPPPPGAVRLKTKG